MTAKRNPCDVALDRALARYEADMRRADQSRDAYHQAILRANEEAGMSVREIGRRTGLTYGRIGQILKAAREAAPKE